MTIEESVRAYLLTLSAVTTITTVIRPDELDQRDKPHERPAIIISVDNEDMDNTLDGVCDMVNARIMVSAISSNKTSARLLAEAIRTNGTNPGTGMAGCTTSGTLPFRAMLESRTSGYIPKEDGSASGLYSVDSMFAVTYYETT